MTDLMPVAGDPLAIADAARAFESIAAQVAVTSAKLRALATANGTWSGTAATRANARTATLPPKLDKVRISYADAGSSLRAYAAALADAQQQSAAAIRAASAAEADLQSARAAQAAAAQRDTEQASATAASGLLPPPPVAPRYDVEISDASSRIARATAANAAAHDDQQRAARGAAARLRQASHEGIKNQPWWRHALSSAAHWASTSWANSLRFVSHVATTISALAGLAALVVSVAGVFFPPLEAAAAALEAISLVAGVMGAAADTALAATGKGSWTSVAVDVVGLAPWAGSALVRKAGRMLRNPATVVHASAGAMADGERVADAAAATVPVRQSRMVGDRHEQLIAIADSYRPPGPRDPLTVAVLDTKSGATYAGRSGFSSRLDPRVRGALDSVPEHLRPLFHGRCAEIDCLNQAVKQGDDTVGSVVLTARVRGQNSAMHGTTIEPCPSCAWVLNLLGGVYKP